MTGRQRILIISGTGRHAECHRRTFQPCDCPDGPGECLSGLDASAVRTDGIRADVRSMYQGHGSGLLMCGVLCWASCRAGGCGEERARR